MASRGFNTPTLGFALNSLLKLFSLFINSSLKNFNSCQALFSSSSLCSSNACNFWISRKSSSRDGLSSNSPFSSLYSSYINDILFLFSSIMLLNSFFISCVHSICSFTRLCSFFSFCLFCSSSLYWYSVFSLLIYSPCSFICCSILFDSDRIWSSRSTNVFFVFKCDLRSSSSYLPFINQHLPKMPNEFSRSWNFDLVSACAFLSF